MRGWRSLPPISQSTRNGWGTEVYSKSENALKTQNDLGLLIGGVFCAELAELFEGGGGEAGVDGLGGAGDAFLEVAGESGGDEDGGRVEQDDLAAGSGDAGEDVVEEGAVGGDVAAGELVECGAGEAGHFGGDAGGFELGLAGVVFEDAGDDGFAGGGELVDAVGAVNDEGAASAEGEQGAADEEDAAGGEDADDLDAGLSGVGERSDEIEDGAEAEGAAEGAEGFHGGVVEGREEEDESGFAEALDGELGGEVDGDAEGFEDVGSSAAGGDGAVAVLGDAGSGRSGDEGGSAGDVEGLGTAAAGSDAIDELAALGVGEGHGGGVAAHDVDKAGELGSLFAAGGEHGEQGGRFDLGDGAGEDFFEDFSGLLAGESGAVLGQRTKEFFCPGHRKSMAEGADEGEIAAARGVGFKARSGREGFHFCGVCRPGKNDDDVDWPNPDFPEGRMPPLKPRAGARYSRGRRIRCFTRKMCRIASGCCACCWGSR